MYSHAQATQKSLLISNLWPYLLVDAMMNILKAIFVTGTLLSNMNGNPMSKTKYSIISQAYISRSPCGG